MSFHILPHVSAAIGIDLGEHGFERSLRWVGTMALGPASPRQPLPIIGLFEVVWVADPPSIHQADGTDAVVILFDRTTAFQTGELVVDSLGHV